MTAPTDVIDVYRSTVNELYAHVSRRCGGARELAEDVTQETYLRAVADWSRGPAPDRPLAWLKTVASNLVRDHFRRRRPEPLDVEGAAVIESEPSDHPPRAALLQWGIGRLDPEPAALLEAFYFDGSDQRTLAEALSVSDRAIEGRLRRAREQLRSVLAPHFDDGEPR